MPRYELSSAADTDLSEIYAYSFIEFGEQRANAYFESLEDCLQRLAATPKLGMNVDGLRRRYLRFIHQRHSIYYKKARSGILVVRVLGPGMSDDKNLP